MFAEEEAELLAATARTPAELAALVDRRVAGEPLEHILGWADFCGLRIIVEPGVFVPRRRTEFLVRQAAALARPGAIVADLCCGSGAVAAALAAVVDGIEVYAVDLDPVAVRCARRNLPRGHIYQGDLYEPLPAPLRGRIELLVANTPYVPTGEVGLMPSDARMHEPRVAHEGGEDGLDIVRRLAAAAPAWLAPGGHLLVETSAGQATRAVTAFTSHGLAARVAAADDATVVIGVRESG